LSALAVTLHSGAVALTGIDQTSPVRASMTASGTAATSGVVIASAPGDLVVDFVGHGTSINLPAMGQTLIYLHNVSAVDTLDNSAASSAPGASPSITMGWAFGTSDEFQALAASLRPAM
jgi:hypothetical protein